MMISMLLVNQLHDSDKGGSVENKTKDKKKEEGACLLGCIRIMLAGLCGLCGLRGSCGCP